MGKIYVFYGPSSAGKSIIQKMLTTPTFPCIVTSTTRAQRMGEVDGIDYIFMSHELFKSHVDHGDFLEWTSYNGENYGTLKASIDKLYSSSEDAHIIMDLAGVIALKALYPATIAIYIGANLESIQRRLVERGSKPNEISWRLNKAKSEELTETYIQAANMIFWNNDGTELSETVRLIREALL